MSIQSYWQHKCDTYYVCTTENEMNYAGGDEVIKTPSTPQRQKAFKLSMRLIILWGGKAPTISSDAN